MVSELLDSPLDRSVRKSNAPCCNSCIDNIKKD